MTTPFYAPPSCFTKDRVILPADEARHAVKVLRMRTGDGIVVVDGVGGWYEVTLTRTERDEVEGNVVATRRDVGETNRNVVLSLGLLHHRDRFEWAVEKAVELGVTGIVPLRTRRAAPGKIRRDRLEHIAVAAMKQSMRTRLPQLYEEMTLDEALVRLSPTGTVLIAHEAAPDAPTPAQAAGHTRSVSVLIGPEGGFSDDEIEAASAAGATLVSLGPRRLRAETAALTALADLMLHL